MSRVGKKLIPTSNGVTVNVSGQDISVKGPKGSLPFRVPDDIKIVQTAEGLTFEQRHDNPRTRAMWGMVRAIVANNVKGVTEGFEKNLELVGVGYRAAVQAKVLNLTLGFSHAIVYPIPDGITIETPTQTEILVKGVDRQRVGQTASEIRDFRPPEPYKGKGVKYSDEKISLKEAKKK